MLHEILNIKGLQKIEKEVQKTILGGYMPECTSDEDCFDGYCNLARAICVHN